MFLRLKAQLTQEEEEEWEEEGEMQYGQRESKPLGKYHIMLPSGARWDRGQCAKLFLSLRAVVVLPTRSRNLARSVEEWVTKRC